jgi:hypothetical protein
MPLKKLKKALKGTIAGKSSSVRDKQNAAYANLLRKSKPKKK